MGKMTMITSARELVSLKPRGQVILSDAALRKKKIILLLRLRLWIECIHFTRVQKLTIIIILESRHQEEASILI